jgi:hypothetical protein
MIKITTFLIIALINSLCINGVWLVTREGMLFGFIQKWYIEKFNTEKLVKQSSWWWMPTFGCVTCMASFWSLALFSLFYRFYLPALWIVPLMLCSAYLNTLLFKINDRL